MAEVKNEKDRIILRSYSKGLFFYPLLLTSFIFWIIQAVQTNFGAGPNETLGYIWFVVFFINLFVISFDFPVSKFLILVLAVVITLLMIIFLVLPALPLPTPIVLNLGSSAEFYAVMTLILFIILGFIVLSTHFNYYIIEKNEIFHVLGIFSNTAERYPVRGLRFRHVISDVFEYLLLGVGSITLIPKDSEPIHLSTVIRVSKKVNEMDLILSHLAVKVDDINE